MQFPAMHYFLPDLLFPYHQQTYKGREKKKCDKELHCEWAIDYGKHTRVKETHTDMRQKMCCNHFSSVVGVQALTTATLRTNAPDNCLVCMSLTRGEN